MNDEKMKPCPWCGDSEKLAIYSDRVFCPTCCITGPEVKKEIQKREITNAWNRRANEDN